MEELSVVTDLTFTATTSRSDTQRRKITIRVFPTFGVVDENNSILQVHS